VSDLQARLRALDHPSAPDPGGCYGVGTVEAVRSFQRGRGLRQDGVCGQQTWAALVESGRVLGERLLYYRNRMVRGDDVADLQRQLGGLGFDAGRVDGIFGPRTQVALCDFQRNTGLPVDGISGPATLQMLGRVSTRATAPEVVAELRERERLRVAPRTITERRVIVGEEGGLSALADGVRRVLSRLGAVAMTLHDPDGSHQASQANALSADVYVGLRLEPELDGCGTAYFLGYNGVSSEGGRRLAEIVQATLPGALGVPDRGTSGMRLPILRETRMPAVVIELGPPAVVVERGADVATAIGDALTGWVSAPGAV
jgi:N-acetylmuramoyl-L-alanine amidase